MFSSHHFYPQEATKGDVPAQQRNKPRNQGSRKQGILYKISPRMKAKKRPMAATGPREQVVQTGTGRWRAVGQSSRQDKRELMFLSV
jgi:hypothetical protein